VGTVFFDAGGTILQVRGSVGEIYASAAARRGHPVDPAAVMLAFRTAWERSLERRREAGWLSSDPALREEWRQVVADSFDGLVPRSVAAEAFEELYDFFSGPEPWDVAPGAIATFEALRRRGIRIGLLSNWDSRLLTCLDRLRLRSWFDPVVVSFEVGVEKPHPEIFRVAAERAGRPPPSSILMVGDSYELDIAPAVALGWRALWIEGDPRRARAAGVAVVGGFPEVMERIEPLLVQQKTPDL